MGKSIVLRYPGLGRPRARTAYAVGGGNDRATRVAKRVGIGIGR